MGEQARSRHLRGERLRQGRVDLPRAQTTSFLLVENDGNEGRGRQLKVVYTGERSVPDTFKDHAEALAGGQMGTDGVFRANKIQAKCASKYEAAPPKLNASAPQGKI